MAFFMPSLAELPELVGFFSYSREDDAYIWASYPKAFSYIPATGRADEINVGDTMSIDIADLLSVMAPSPARCFHDDMARVS
jgi:hypothetical protein